MIKMIKGGVTAAKGFCAASTAAGIKYQNRQDMAMLYSEVPCAVAGTFTSNLVKAAPVKWDQKIDRRCSGPCSGHQCGDCQCVYRRGGNALLQTDGGKSR